MLAKESRGTKSRKPRWASIGRRDMLKLAAAAGAMAFTGLPAKRGWGTSAIPVLPNKPYAGATLQVLAPRMGFTDTTAKFLGEFEALTGIKVRYDLYSFPDGYQKAGVELAAGTGAYDVVWAENMEIPQYGKAGWIEPLDTFLNDRKYTDLDQFKPDEIPAGPLDSYRLDGKLYGLPFHAGCCIVYYRTDVVGKYGFKAAPDTFDEFLEIAKKIHTKEIPAVALRGARGRDNNMWIYPTFFNGFGAKWFKDYPKDMHPTVDSPEAVRSLEYFCTVAGDYGIPNAASANFDDIILAIQEGKAAMTIDGAPLGSRFLDPVKSRFVDQLDVALVPKGPAGRFPPLNAHGWTIAKASKKKEAAWEFLKWSASPEVHLKAAVEGWHVSVMRNSVWKHPDFVKKYGFKGGKYLSLFNETLRIGSALYRPPIPEWARMGERFSVSVNEALTKQKKPAQAMKELQEDLFKLFKDAGHYKA